MGRPRILDIVCGSGQVTIELAHLSGGSVVGIVNEYLLPKRCWWTDYYAPLEDRLRLLREERGHEMAAEKLDQYEREIAMVKANPDRFDCGFFILQRW